ncbi:MAG: outer membrane beta-barrel protein, partial [Ginsengibacter sp.]
MRKFIAFFLTVVPLFCLAQGGLGIGLKAGYNFANVTSASSINSSSQSGYMFGVFLAPNTKGILTSRHEFIYSRQGYNFDNGTTTGNVNLDYIIIPQMMGINITKYVQIQLGLQMAYLLNAKADTADKNTGVMGSYGSALSY